MLSAFPWLQSCTTETRRETTGERARIAVIGTGSRGQYHLANLIKNPKADVVALCDNYAPNLEAASAYYPNARKYSDYRDVLNLKEVDGVIVTTPLHEHAHITIDAFAAGKHVFCEKSLARTLDDCRAMYDAYQASGLIFFVGQQRLFDPKYIRAMELVREGVIGDLVGFRTYWFRNNDWRRPVSVPGLERKINWRLYKEYSAGMMTELATHQLQVGNWAMQMIPDTVTGFGDITSWKDDREVYDNISLIYRYANGVKMTYESIISNKFYGLEEQILGRKGTIEPEKGRYYFEEAPSAPGIQQLINQIEHGLFDNVSFAGPSWVPETAAENKGNLIVGNSRTHDGASSTGAVGDGSEELMDAYLTALITGKQVPVLVEEAYYSSTLALLGEKAMDEGRVLTFPDEYKIPYLNFAAPATKPAL